jgi:hypothetical protein
VTDKELKIVIPKSKMKGIGYLFVLITEDNVILTGIYSVISGTNGMKDLIKQDLIVMVVKSVSYHILHIKEDL